MLNKMNNLGIILAYDTAMNIACSFQSPNLLGFKIPELMTMANLNKMKKNDFFLHDK